MSKRSGSTFSKNAEIYEASSNYVKSVARKEILNSVNRSNANHAIVTNYGKDNEGFTSLLHVAINHGDRFMCQRVLSINEINLKLTDSDGETALELARRLDQGVLNKGASLLLEFVGEKKPSSKGNASNPLSKILKKIKKFVW